MSQQNLRCAYKPSLDWVRVGCGMCPTLAVLRVAKDCFARQSFRHAEGARSFLAKETPLPRGTSLPPGPPAEAGFSRGAEEAGTKGEFRGAPTFVTADRVPSAPPPSACLAFSSCGGPFATRPHLQHLSMGRKAGGPLRVPGLLFPAPHLREGFPHTLRPRGWRGVAVRCHVAAWRSRGFTARPPGETYVTTLSFPQMLRLQLQEAAAAAQRCPSGREKKNNKTRKCVCVGGVLWWRMRVCE